MIYIITFLHMILLPTVLLFNLTDHMNCTTIALSTALRRYKRQRKRDIEASSHLGTIFEQCPYDNNDHTSHVGQQTVINLQEYPKRNVIFHLTGGGFFAHTISGDIPFLLDWSSVTKAIVICPEYALLPGE